MIMKQFQSFGLKCLTTEMVERLLTIEMVEITIKFTVTLIKAKINKIVFTIFNELISTFNSS